jgi:hypothetical protein
MGKKSLDRSGARMEGFPSLLPSLMQKQNVRQIRLRLLATKAGLGPGFSAVV